jgi:hypothetical protein
MPIKDRVDVGCRSGCTLSGCDHLHHHCRQLGTAVLVPMLSVSAAMAPEIPSYNVMHGVQQDLTDAPCDYLHLKLD